MRNPALWISVALLLWIGAASHAADDGIGAKPSYDCRGPETPDSCTCSGYIDCSNLYRDGLCRDSQGATIFCCTQGGSTCSCKVGGGQSCPEGTRPFDPSQNPNTKPGTGETSGTLSPDAPTGGEPSGAPSRIPRR